MMLTLLWVPTCSLHTHTQGMKRPQIIITSAPAAPVRPLLDLLLPVDGSQLAEGLLHVNVQLPEAVLPPELEQVEPATAPRVRDLLEGPRPYLPSLPARRHRCRRRGAQRPAVQHLPADAGVGRDVHVLHGPPVSARVVSRCACRSAALLLTSLNVSR